MNILDVILVIISICFGVLTLYLYNRYKKQEKENVAQNEAIKDQFYEIVHELRAPLTAVKDASILLHDMPGKLTAEEQTKMLTLINNECTRLLEQVSGILDASKVMNNKLTIQKTPNDIRNLLQDKIIMFTPQANNQGLKLQSDIDPQLPLIMYDAKYMGQVINNLISNSLKYTPQGGTITISAKSIDGHVEISVFDNGLGVADEKQKEMFNKFASLNNKNNAIASSGLGLYVVKGIVEAHGGKVGVESRQGRGYKVNFTLPLQGMPASLTQH